WCNIHGHRHPTIDAAIRKQLEQVAHVTLLGMAHPTTVKLARRLVEIAPASLNHVFFSDDGATAVEVALKMAFQYWRQRRIPLPLGEGGEQSEPGEGLLIEAETLTPALSQRERGPSTRTKYLAWDNAYH